MVGLIVQNHAELAHQVASLMIHQRPELADDLEAVKHQVRTFLVKVCESIVYGIAIHVSQSVGAPSLARSIERISSDHSENQLYQLFDVAIRLDHFHSFPEQKTETLRKELAGKPSTSNILRRLVWRHLNLFEVKYDQRQKLCKRYDIQEKALLAGRRKSGFKK
jgi:hypothetical protein